MESNFKSPIKKLNTFFLKSRDRWKAKAKDANEKIRTKDKRILFLEDSKKSLKDQVKELKEQIKNLKNDKKNEK